jgi:cellobiose-specific phosphotransferase system component IIC
MFAIKKMQSRIINVESVEGYWTVNFLKGERLIVSITKATTATAAYTKYIMDKVSLKMTNKTISSSRVRAENHRQSNVPGSVPSL